MASPTDVVLAGTKAFALALFAPLTERLGTRPRIAPDPQQALAQCATSSGILVVEFAPAWLPALTQLRRQAAGLRIVAALPAGQESAALTLGPLGIEAVPWDGQPGPVLAAVAQVLEPGAAAAPPAPPPAPAATSPAPHVAAPPAAPPPVAARPVAPAPPRVAVTPILGTPPVASPPAPARPTGPPAAPRAPSVPASPRVAVTPVRGTPPVAAPAPSAAPTVPPPVAAPPVAPPVAPAAAVAPGSDDPVDLFADLGGTEATPEPGSLPAADPFASAAAGAASLYVPPVHQAAAAWPATVPTSAEASQALVAALAGRLAEGSPLRLAADQAVAMMSGLERRVLTGEGVPFDEAPLRAAAVLRLRIATAISTRPPVGSPVDQPAVEALLAELDTALSAVNALLPGASDELRPALEVVRNALVKEAVDFSEASQTGAVKLQPAAPRSAGARLISIATAAAEKPETRRGVIVLLVLALLAAAGFHGYRWVQKERAVAGLPTLPGAPERMMLLPSAPGQPKVLVPVRGLPDRAQVERFKAEQQQLGFEVIELQGGGLSVARKKEPPRPQESVTP